MREFMYDVKLFASVRINAPNERAARKKLLEALDCATANFGADPDSGDPILGEVSADDSIELIEIDGKEF